MTKKELESEAKKIRELFYKYKPETRQRHLKFNLYISKLVFKVMFWRFIHTFIPGDS